MSRSFSLMKDSFVPTRRVNPVKATQITLTDAESQLCSLLREFTSHLKTTANQDVECRIAGGWVRDKVEDRIHRWRTISLNLPG
jgi:hypothetical protein